MNRTIAIIFCILTLVGLLVFGGVSSETGNEILRIHIRANSNEQIDQAVKYKVKEQIVEYLTPLLSSCTNKTTAENIINHNLRQIENVANMVLQDNNFNYTSTAKINNEFFPDRVYDGYVVESGYYDALILELGSGTGDNWWCVVYPPLCFVNTTYTNGNGIVYKSKLLEIIKEFFGE